MFGRKTRERLARIEAALESIAAVQVKQADALNLDTPGGMTAVISVARDAAADAKAARQHAEYADAGMRAVATVLDGKPGLSGLTQAVSAQADAIRAIDATVRAATGPQPILKVKAPAAEPAPPAPPAAAKGMGARVKPGKM